jgi:hypothetical protein
LQIVAELCGHLVLPSDWQRRRRRDRARFAQHQQPPCQRRSVATLDGLLPGSVTEIPTDHMFIQIDEHGVAARDPTQEIAHQVETPPSPAASEADFDEMRPVQLDELSVSPTLQAPERPARAQVLFGKHHLSSAY